MKLHSYKIMMFVLIGILFLSVYSVYAETAEECALMRAAGAGQTEIINSLLAKGADVNAKDVTGITALKFATNGGHTEIIRLLKQSGASE